MSEIELPPLPFGTFGEFAKALKDYGHECYEAGLAARRADPAKPAKPKVHRAVVELSREGFAWTDAPPNAEWIVANVTLCWTDGEDVWIDSERNRELASSLRREWGFSVAADALDGGVR